MQFITLFIFFFSFCFYAQANNTILFENGVIVNYKSGYLDNKTYNGFITDLEFIKDNKVLANANSLKIQSTKSKSNGGYDIDLFNLKDLIIRDEEVFIKISDIKITDFNTLIFNGLDQIQLNQFETHKNFSLEINNIFIENKDYVFNVSSITIPKIKYNILPSGKYFAENSEFYFNEISIKPNPQNLNLLPAHLVLAALGKNAFVFDFDSKINIDNKGFLMTVNANLNLEMKGGIKFNFSLNYLVPLHTLNNLEKYQKQFDEYQDSKESINYEAIGKDIFSALGSIQLSSLVLNIEDIGLRKPAMMMMSSSTGITEEESIENINSVIKAMLSAYIPKHVDEYTSTLSKFLKLGGVINLSIKPPHPVHLIGAAGLMLLPDLAIESLGVTFNHFK